MSKKLIRSLTVLGLLALAPALSACNTARGAGEDISQGGQAVKTGAVDTGQAIKTGAVDAGQGIKSTVHNATE